MDKLCIETTTETIPESKIIDDLPKIRFSELQKQRQTIKPVFERDDITYPKIGIGDVIAVTKNNGETLYYLVIQRTQKQHITYRLDKYKPKRYDFFENHNGIIALIQEHDAKIYHDPLNIRPQKTPPKRPTNVDVYNSGELFCQP